MADRPGQNIQTKRHKWTDRQIRHQTCGQTVTDRQTDRQMQTGEQKDKEIEYEESLACVTAASNKHLTQYLNIYFVGILYI